MPEPPDDRSDETLIARCAAREPDALAALYDRHRALAFGVVLRILGDVGAAEDALQDAFLGVWRHAGAFDPARGSGRTWILSVAHHRAVDALRRRRPVSELPEPDAPVPSALVGPDVWPEVAGRLEAEAVRRALDTIPSAQREAIELAYWGGLSQSEIADRLSIPLGTVKGRMRLGLLALRGALGSEAGSDGSGPMASDAAGAGDRGGSRARAHGTGRSTRSRATAAMDRLLGLRAAAVRLAHRVRILGLRPTGWPA